jgi:1,4-dihydroxy-2-naphthoate octaprenyltransferase
MIVAAFVTAWVPWLAGGSSAWLLLTLAAAPLAVPLVRAVRTRTDGPSLNRALAGTGLLQLAFCVLLSAGVLAGGS